MHLSEAYSLVEQGEPRDEESVDLTCSNCAGEWSSRFKSVHRAGGPEVIFVNYVGSEHRDLSADGKDIYYCPNGCSDFLDRRVELCDIHSNHGFTPYDRWQCATLLVRQHELATELESIEKELRNYGDLL